MKRNFKNGRLSYRSVKFISKFGSPAFRVMMYVSLVCSAVLVIMAPIIFLVNIPTQEMILPPYMKAVGSGGNIESYNIFIGNGIRINADAANVTLSDIKTVIYAGIFMTVAVLLVFAPICKFLSALFSNISKGTVLDEKNADLISYIGITVIIGNTIILFLRRFYNYLLVSTFLDDGKTVNLALNIDWYGIIVGTFILLTGLIFGYACECSEKQKCTELQQQPPADDAE